MKSIQKIWCVFIILNICFNQRILPLTQRYFHLEDLGYNYQRGTYLIVLADAELDVPLREESTGNFVYFKQTEGYNVKVISLQSVLNTAANLKNYLEYYYNNIDPLLEYVLLIGDVGGPYHMPSFTIPSYNESDLDVTDYRYTYFNNDYKHPKFFIGRWPIRSVEDLKKMKSRTIQYRSLSYVDPSYLKNALIVAGNYSDTPPWPVTPVMTSKWLMDELHHFGYFDIDCGSNFCSNIDTAFFHFNNQEDQTSLITSKWNEGVGVINYRGWGDANGWHYPYFHRENIDPGLQNGFRLPVVMSFVCNTGDFGNDYSGVGLDRCFGEVLITGGSLNNPKGAVAMVGPSDLDTDTRFNNVMCAVMWDELLEGRIPELAPALHMGKQALIKEFDDLEINGTNIVEFYHHVYGVLGDPSLPVWLGEPKNMIVEGIESNPTLLSSYVSTTVKSESGEPLMDAVGAIIYEGELIAKGLSNSEGKLVVDFPSAYANSELTLYINKNQFYQKSITLQSGSLNDDAPLEYNYIIPEQNSQYSYVSNIIDYNWIEINGRVATDTLSLTDDSFTEIDMGLNIMYYGKVYNSLTVCSNGWVSFEPCLKSEGSSNECSTLPYFFNNSITNPLGPYGMVAPFFDDLDDNEGQEPFKVYFWTNSIDSVIIEWDNIANGQHDEDCLPNDAASCPRHTFQLILDNNQTNGSNSQITFQYKDIEDIDDHGSTIGIESPDKNSGVEFLFNRNPDTSAQLLQDGLAIKITQICDGSIGFNACDCAGNVKDCEGVCGGAAVVDVCGVCNGDGFSCKYGCILDVADNYDPTATQNDGSCIIKGCTNVYSENFNALATDDDGSCILLSIKSSLFPDSVTLYSYPNPFNPIVTVSFAIAEMGHTVVNVYDIRGRELVTLTRQSYQPGYYSVNWEASAHTSGVYFITLATESTRLTQKVLLLK